VSLPLPPSCTPAYNFIRPITSGKAILGAVFGLLSFAFGVVASVPAFLCAARALREIDRDRAHLTGRRLAQVGIIAAGLGLFVQPVLLVFGVQFVRGRQARATDAANLYRIGEAMHAYHADQTHFPPAAGKDAMGQPLLSWRVALLPYLGKQELYEQFHLDEPWDSPHNLTLIGRMPKVYAHPADPDAAKDGLTYYRVFVGKQTPFDAQDGPMIPHDFLNGTSRMILVAAAAGAVPWTKPDELPYDPDKPVPRLGGLLSGGYNVLLADGEVRFVRDDLEEEVLRRAIDRDFPLGW
jgi:hypothetical protein